MKKIFILIFTLFIIISCGKSNIEKIKGATLKYDESITVGNAFGNYKYCDSIKWEEIKTEQGRNVVRWTCDFNGTGIEVSNSGISNVKRNWIIQVDFALNPKNNGFRILQFIIIDKNENDKSVVTNECLIAPLITSIYKNEMYAKDNWVLLPNYCK